MRQTGASTILKASINGNFDLHLESGRAHSPLSHGMTEGTTSQVHADNHIHSDNSNTTGVTYINFGANLGVSGAGLPQLSSPSSRSFSSIRYLNVKGCQSIYKLNVYNFKFMLSLLSSIFLLCKKKLMIVLDKRT